MPMAVLSDKIYYRIRMLMCVVLKGETGKGASSKAVLGAAVCTHVLYSGLYSCRLSSLGADPFTSAVPFANQS